MDYSTRKTAYSMLKEKLALLPCKEGCQIVQEATSQSPQRKKITTLAILLGEDEDDDSTVFTTSEEFDKYLKATPLRTAWSGGAKITALTQTW